MKKYKVISMMRCLALLLVTFVVGCSNSDNSPPVNAKAFTAYSLTGVPGTLFTGTINEPAKTITVVDVPVGTDLTALVATFTTTATGVMVGATPQISAATPNNFTSPVTYIVTAADNSKATYTVTVVPTTARTIAAYSFVGLPASPGIINEAAKTIAVTVPSDTDLATLTTSAATVTGAAKLVQKSAALNNLADFVIAPDGLSATFTVTITAADGTRVTYTVTVTKAPSSAKAITAFSFVGFTAFAGTINEAAKTIAVDLPSGTDVRNLTATFATAGKVVKVDTTVQISGGAPSNNFTSPVAYTVTAVDGTTATYAVTVIIAPDPAKVITAYSFAGFTGAAGTVNETAKTIAVTVPYGTDVTNLKATFTTTGTVVKVGTAVQTSTATENDFTNPVAYLVTAADGSTTPVPYTVTVTLAPSNLKTITAYSFVGFTAFPGTINETAKTIAVTLPFGTPVTALTAKFTSTGTVVKVGTVVQTSEAAPTNDFTLPKAYTVTAADLSTTPVPYTVTVTLAPSTLKTITAYSFVGFTAFPGTINETAKTIAVTLPFGTPVTALTAKFTSTGTVVKIGGTIQTSEAAPTNDFTLPKAYTVTAADLSTTSVPYTVTVTFASASAKTITAYSFVGFTAFPGTINETAKTIAVTLPLGTPVTALTAKFTSTGTVVKVGTVVQTSEAAPTNDFTLPKAYTVTAADLSTTPVPYTVTVTFAIANPTAPNLGETARFVILASQKVTTTAGSAISNGDLGIIDQARSYYEGFVLGASPGQFTVLTNGLSYAHDDMPPYVIPAPYASTIAFLDQVRTDLGIAYNFLAAATNPSAPTQVCATQLGGLTLSRGFYKTASDVQITTGPLHLDAQGDPNAVFIFTIDGTLTIGAPSGAIILDGGALAKNVYFRSGGITTIEAGVIAYGNIFAKSQVNALAGANITGRLFAVDDQVTLISDIVTKAP
jgi:hypothetical protein